MSRQMLVVGPAWVGDMVMAQSLFIALRRREPELAIDVLAPSWSLPIISRMPEVRRGIEGRFPHGQLALGERWRVGRRLRKDRYDEAIVLPRSFKSALVPFFARVPKRVGFGGEGRSWLLTDARTRRPTRVGNQVADRTVWRYLGLAATPEEYGEYRFEDVPTPRLTIDPRNTARLIAKLGLSPERPAVGICPGAAYGPAKQWPLTKHRELARRLASRGHQVWVMGGPGDAEAGATIASVAEDRVHNLCGTTGLADVVDLSARTECVVTHDSGLMHVAAAAGTKVIAIYGGSSPEFTPPLTDRAVIFQPQGLECAPCFDRTCRFGHYACMEQTTVEGVLAAATA